MSGSERIGILGGSFNPVHLGHLILAENAADSFSLDRVLFMPCHIQPLKGQAGTVAAEQRVAMTEAAIMDNPRFELLDIEIKRGGTSYAIDSVREIRRFYPGAEVFFIIGADTLSELHLWKDINVLLEICQFAVLARPGYDLDAIFESGLKLSGNRVAQIRRNVATGRLIDISSSDIRQRVAEGRSIRYLVPRSVEMYIAEHHLYQN